LILGAGLVPAFAGDSLYGKVTQVKSAAIVTLDSGGFQHDIRLIGIDVPAEGPLAKQAKKLLASLVLGKNARMRFEYEEKGLMVCRLFTDDQVLGIKDVGLELVKAGLAQRQTEDDTKYGYKYGELSAAENQARTAKRGLWAPAQPR
jgi:endonuclease YncB( thermonuclease family)